LATDVWHSDQERQQRDDNEGSDVRIPVLSGHDVMLYL
jgi:hypothetical protein